MAKLPECLKKKELKSMIGVRFSQSEPFRAFSGVRFPDSLAQLSRGFRLFTV